MAKQFDTFFSPVYGLSFEILGETKRKRYFEILWNSAKAACENEPHNHVRYPHVVGQVFIDKCIYRGNFTCD